MTIDNLPVSDLQNGRNEVDSSHYHDDTQHVVPEIKIILTELEIAQGAHNHKNLHVYIGISEYYGPSTTDDTWFISKLSTVHDEVESVTSTLPSK